jgi:hypothetical protein
MANKMPRVYDVKFSALGVDRSHLQDVVQVDYAQRLYDELATAQAVIVAIRDVQGPSPASDREKLLTALDYARSYCAERGIGSDVPRGSDE